MARFLSLFLLPLLTLLPSSHASPQQMLYTGSSSLVEDYKQSFLTSPNADFSCGFYEVGGNVQPLQLLVVILAAVCIIT